MSFNISDVMAVKQNQSPMRSYLWRVLLPDLTIGLNNTNAVYGNGVESAVGIFSFNSRINQEISNRVSNMAIPFSTIETDKDIIGNSYWYFAKHNDIGSISIELHEHEDGLTLSYFQAWQDLMANTNGTYNSPSIYKKDLVFYRLSSDKNDIVVHTYHGYFVSGIADITNDYDSNTTVKYGINLTGDSVSHQNIALTDIKSVKSKVNTLDDLGSVLDIINIIGATGTIALF